MIPSVEAYLAALSEMLGDYSVEFMSCSDIQRVYGNAGICSYNYDYLFPGKVQVALYDDRLEVTSPGMLDTELTIEQMKTGLSRIRNRGIAELFAYMHMIEGWGSGIPDMFMDAKQYGLPEPTLEDRGSDFRVNLYRRTLETDLFGVVNPKNIGDNENSGGTNNPDADKMPENADKMPINPNTTTENADKTRH